MCYLLSVHCRWKIFTVIYCMAFEGKLSTVSAQKVHFWDMFSETLTFKNMTLKMSSVSCGPSNEFCDKSMKMSMQSGGEVRKCLQNVLLLVQYNMQMPQGCTLAQTVQELMPPALSNSTVKMVLQL